MYNIALSFFIIRRLYITNSGYLNYCSYKYYIYICKHLGNYFNTEFYRKLPYNRSYYLVKHATNLYDKTTELGNIYNTGFCK